jgi:hypothetical protein
MKGVHFFVFATTALAAALSTRQGGRETCIANPPPTTATLTVGQTLFISGEGAEIQSNRLEAPARTPR